ncbi:Putative RNA-binding protein RbpE [Halomicronema hongdechloris C2206]|uniref:RNA-binding protein RbpE n=1 Tax=Halomicronema hongdechloris C2206 TaxID=1641165 RepID=A0A1Z3HVK4_9CYAN|nr:RNA-binding protein [Halomicronema hongdechloris]ASC74334.1 Putative RNA-binding protein RbpE [Halomicronema hongdechloris C2206]
MSVRLYVGNLPKELERQDLEAVFAECSEDVVSIKLISDRKTGKCRGFGFVTVKDESKADEIAEKYNGYLLQDTPLKVEKALPRSKSKSDDGSADTNNGSGSRRNKSNKGSKSGRRDSGSSGSSAAQPDPRWADELAKLKELLATQTTSS